MIQYCSNKKGCACLIENISKLINRCANTFEGKHIKCMQSNGVLVLIQMRLGDFGLYRIYSWNTIYNSRTEFCFLSIFHCSWLKQQYMLAHEGICHIKSIPMCAACVQ